MGQADRFRASRLLSESAKEQQPDNERKKCSEAGINENQRFQLLLQPDAHKEQAGNYGE
jgi:hypothetical protein